MKLLNPRNLPPDAVILRDEDGKEYREGDDYQPINAEEKAALAEAGFIAARASRAKPAAQEPDPAPEGDTAPSEPSAS